MGQDRAHLLAMQQRQQRDADGRDQQGHREQLLAGQQLERGRRAGQRPGRRRMHAAAHEDLVSEDERDRREQSHRHVGMAQRLRDERGAEPVDEARHEAPDRPVDEAPCRQESQPGGERDAGGDEDVVGDHRAEERGDGPQQKAGKIIEVFHIRFTPCG